MKKLRLVDLLLMVANKELNDKQMVLIDDDSYEFDVAEEKFYLPKTSSYRTINTWNMNLTCYILEDCDG